MEPFTINCDTCNSRIRVRNSALLGQLVNCPKCDSLVMVTPPAVVSPGTGTPSTGTPSTAIAPSPGGSGQREPRIEVQRHDRPSVDSAALTQEGLPTELISEPPPTAPTRSPDDESDDEYRIAPEMPAATHAPSPPPIQTADRTADRTADHFALPTDISPPATGVPAAWGSQATPHLPSDDWTSDATTKTRQMLLVGFLGIAGVLLAALLFVGFLRWYGKQDAQDIADSATASTPPAASIVSPEDAEIPTQPDGSPDAAPLVDSAATPELADADQTGANPPADAMVADRAQLATNDSTGKPIAEGVTENTDEPVAEPVVEQPSVALPKQLQAFGPMLQYELQPQFSDAMEILSEAPVTAEDLGLTASTDAVEIPAIDLQAQSQIVVPALVMGDLPLSQFASLWSNLSGIPTGVDLASLTAAGIDRNQSIGLAMVKSVTLGSLIDQLGAPLGLQAVPHDNRFLELVAPAAAMEEHLPQDVLLAGLVDAEQEAWLLEALPQLFPRPAASAMPADAAAPADNADATDNPEAADDTKAADNSEAAENAETTGGAESPAAVEASGEFDALEGVMSAAQSELAEASLPEPIMWKIEQGRLLRPLTASGQAVDPRIWSAAVQLLEGWRHAAGLPANSANFDPALHSARLVAASEVAGLDFVLQQVQAEARPLSQIIPSICRDAGLQAWMDWPALTSLGIDPSTNTLVLTNARPLRRALADYVSRFSLVVAVLDNHSLWITSNHAYRTSPRLVVIPSEGESVEDWTSRLRPLTPAAPDGVGVGHVVVIATPDTKFMLVRCCLMQVDFQ